MTFRDLTKKLAIPLVTVLALGTAGCGNETIRGARYQGYSFSKYDGHYMVKFEGPDYDEDGNLRERAFATSSDSIIASLRGGNYDVTVDRNLLSADEIVEIKPSK